MRTRSRVVVGTARMAVPWSLAMLAVLALCLPAAGQVFERTRSVGGIFVDLNGILDIAAPDDLGKLSRLRAEGIDEIPAELAGGAPLRKISLRRLEAAIQAHKGEELLPDEIRYLAGLQQIRYLFVFPEQGDIVLVGPGEGWKADRRGNVVGVTTGRPVMLLDDLLVALRTAHQAARGGISCSIDPTQEGLARLQRHVAGLRQMGNPRATAAGIEQALGPQQISVQGVPATSHFARVLVAADYRMKRLAMKFDPTPIRELPSFLDMIPASGRGMSNMLPRWWLEPNYEPIVKSSDGLAFEFRGAGVKCMTEADFVAASGQKRVGAKASPMAQRWADNMTEHYDELAVAEPIFGELRNCMELAIVAALIAKERLTERAGYSMPLLTDPEDVAVDEFPAPRQVDSKVSMVRKRGGWVISASGGVMLNSWQVADRTQQNTAPVEVRTKSASTENTNWWWN